MRRPLLVLCLLSVPLTGGLAGQVTASPGLEPCEGVTVHLQAPQPLEMDCGRGEIRPGTFSDRCTLDFVLTDGQDTYLGTAGHCGGVGTGWSVTGLGQVGTTVVSEFNGQILGMRDWSLVEIEDEDEMHVSGTMRAWAGPTTPPSPAPETRPPVPGETVLQVGHGRGFGEEDATRARAGPVVALGPSGTWFAYAGTVGPGDSGSPVRFETGEPAGIAVAGGVVQRTDEGSTPYELCVETLDGDTEFACQPIADACALAEGACRAPFHDGALYPVVIATRFDAALPVFENELGTNLDVVEGALPSVQVSS